MEATIGAWNLGRQAASARPLLHQADECVRLLEALGRATKVDCIVQPGVRDSLNLTRFLDEFESQILGETVKKLDSWQTNRFAIAATAAEFYRVAPRRFPGFEGAQPVCIAIGLSLAWTVKALVASNPEAWYWHDDDYTYRFFEPFAGVPLVHLTGEKPTMTLKPWMFEWLLPPEGSRFDAHVVKMCTESCVIRNGRRTGYVYIERLGRAFDCRESRESLERSHLPSMGELAYKVTGQKGNLQLTRGRSGSLGVNDLYLVKFRYWHDRRIIGSHVVPCAADLVFGITSDGRLGYCTTVFKEAPIPLKEPLATPFVEDFLMHQWLKP